MEIEFKERLAVAKQLYYRCSYADYKPGSDPATLRAKFALATRTRLMLLSLQNVRSDQAGLSARDQEVARQSLTQLAGFQRIGQFVAAACASETLFYLPNHFRQTVMLHSNLISFAQPQQALLDVMNTIFKLDSSRNAGSQKFSIGNFFACYRSFFRSTMPYEALSYCLRVKLHEKMKQDSRVAWVAGPAAGMAS